MTQKFLRDDGTFQPLASSGSSSSGPVTLLTAATTADFQLSTVSFSTGPFVSQGSSGTWLTMGQITLQTSNTAGNITTKLWDGTTVIAAGALTLPGSGFIGTVALSGIITSPAGNLRISAQATQAIAMLESVAASTSGSIITAMRIG